MEIAVISGKGGSGKSSVSAAFISMLSNVVAVDCDVDASNLHLLFNPVWEDEYPFISGSHAMVNKDLCIKCGKCSQMCSFDAIKFEKDFPIINEVSCDGCQLCARECPANAIEMGKSDKSRIYKGKFQYGCMISGFLAPGEENSGKMVNDLRQLSREAAHNRQSNIIILDGPPGIGCPVISTLAGIDKVVIITEPSMSGFSDLERVMQLLQHYDIPTFVIINKSSINSEMTDYVTHWCKDNNISVIATLPFSDEMVKALVSGHTIYEYNPCSEISKKLKKALYKIIN